jgi:glycosyltransferase involved in cell wall biosynthesis
LFGIVHFPSVGKKKGDVLISYLTEPFTIGPWDKSSNYHTMYWECHEIARLFSKKGYACDIIDSQRHTFIPKKNYFVCIDSGNDLERLSAYLPKTCKKVFHILISHWDSYNKAEKDRLDALEKRRGVKLLPRRKMEPSRDAELADFLEGFGNETIFKTFERFNKSIFFIPISAVIEYEFPKDKDFNTARKNFLWFGGGGAVLKGLDITLEAFAKMPNLNLHVCGPVYGEQDFAEEYKKELTETPNIRFYGRLDIASKEFIDIINKCSAIVYPSGGEGSSGAIVQAMHAGLIPIITHETGIREDSGYIPLLNPTPESIAESVTSFSKLPVEEMRKKSKEIWSYAKKTYTRSEFSRVYGKFIDEVLKI